MMSKSEVTIIIPCYNSEKYIKDTIDSVIRQTFPDWKLICIDDASLDETYSILSEYAASDSRIAAYKNENNCGIAYSRNRGIEFADTKYICFLDHDDIYPADCLEKKVSYMDKHPNLGCLGGFSVAFYNAMDMKPRKGKFRNASYCRTGYIFNNLFSNGSSIFRKEIIDDNNFRFEELCGVEDYDFYSKILCVSDIEVLPDTLLYKRIIDTQYTQVCKSDTEKYKCRQKYIDNIHCRLLDRFNIQLNDAEKEIYLRLFHEDNGYGTFSKEEIPIIKSSMSKMRHQILKNRELAKAVAYRQTFEKQFKAINYFKA